ncbi:MAG: PRC-barrel domain-containing protein [Solirubrobacteraceae bacterium]
MTAPIEDVGELPGKEVTDQKQEPIGKITEIYAVGGDGDPAWVAVEGKFSKGKRTVLIPIARLKDENGSLRVPYSRDHIGETPEVDDESDISAECERKLRDHFGIDRGDQELRSDNKSYATRVPEEEGTAKRAEDPSSLEMPDADKRTDETMSRLKDPGSSEIRHITADDVTDDDDSSSEDSDDAKESDSSSENSDGAKEPASSSEGLDDSEASGSSSEDSDDAEASGSSSEDSDDAEKSGSSSDDSESARQSESPAP